jgi:uncharacterized membrane protein
MKEVSMDRFRALMILVLITALLSTVPSANAAGMLRGRVTGDDMNNYRIPLGWAKVTVYANGTRVQSVSPDFDGSYYVSLPPGLYVAAAEHPGYNTQSKVVRVVNGRATRLDFYLERTPPATGHTFDFGLSSNRPLTVLVGELSWITIQVTLLSGSPQNVSLSVSGLPHGASASFSPPFGNPSFSTVCIITTSLDTPVGSYTVTVTGASGGMTSTTSFALITSSRTYSPDMP